LHLQPRGLFVTSATDILVAPDVASYMEEALKQARLPFEILINDVQVFKKKNLNQTRFDLNGRLMLSNSIKRMPSKMRIRPNR
jgi:hypothetical protein